MNKPPEQKKPSLLKVVRTVLSAAIGIQSNKSHEDGFEGGDLKVYIVVGLVFVAVFIATIAMVVSNVIAQ